MESSLSPSQQLISLDQRRDRLAATAEWSPANERLISSLVESEVAKSRGRFGRPVSQPEVAPQRVRTALRRIISLNKPLDQLQVEDLLAVQRLLTADRRASFRQAPPRSFHSQHLSIHPDRIPHSLERLFQWVASPSFAQLHPVEQTVLAQVRLYEIYPFETCGECPISIFSQYFLVAAGFLLPSPLVAEIPQFYQALEMAFTLATAPLVALNLRNCHRSYDLISGATG